MQTSLHTRSSQGGSEPRTFTAVEHNYRKYLVFSASHLFFVGWEHIFAILGCRHKLIHTESSLEN